MIRIVSQSIFLFRSAPEFGSIQRSTMLRKTQSQPNPQKLPTSRKYREDTEGKLGLLDSLPQKSSCPSSPTEKQDQVLVEKLKLEAVKTAPAALGQSSRPKRTLFDGFRNTLRPKSKYTEDKDKKTGGTPGGSPKKQSDAGISPVAGTLDLTPEGVPGLEGDEIESPLQSMPDLLQGSQGAEAYCSLPRLQTVAMTPFELAGAIGGSATLGSDIKWKSSRETSEETSPVRSTVRFYENGLTFKHENSI